jgi:hypothetical protein
MADFYIKKDDTRPVITGDLLNPDFSAVDLTGATVTLWMIQMATGIITTLPGIIDNPSLGQVHHTWLAGETSVSGAYFYRWIVVWSDRQESFPNHPRGKVLSIQDGMTYGAISPSPPGTGGSVANGYHEEFVPSNGATYVTLANTPATVMMVSRNGLVQSVMAGHYSLSGTRLTFAAPFTGSDQVVVSYLA